MLDTRDIIILTAAFYLGSVVSKFFTAVSEDVIVPLLSPAAAAGKGVSSFTVTLGGVTLKIGDLVASLVNLVISFAMVVFVIGLLRQYVLTRIGAGVPK